MALKRNIAGFNSSVSVQPATNPEYSGRLGKVDPADIDAWLQPYTNDGGYSGTGGNTPAIKYNIPVVEQVQQEGSVLNSGAPGAPYMNVPRSDIPPDGDPAIKPLPTGTTENVLPVPAGAGDDKPTNWWPWLLLAGGAYLLYKNGAIGTVGKAKKNKWVTPVFIAGGVGLLYLYSKKKNDGTASPAPIDNGGGGDTAVDPTAGAPAELKAGEQVYRDVSIHAPMYAYSNLDFVSKALIGYATNLDQLGSGELTALYNYITGYVLQNIPLTKMSNESLYAQVVQIKNRYNIPLYI